MVYAYDNSMAATILAARDNFKKAQKEWIQIQNEILLPACKKAMLKKLDYEESEVIRINASYNKLFQIYAGEVVVRGHRFVFNFDIKEDGRVIPTLEFGEKYM